MTQSLRTPPAHVASAGSTRFFGFLVTAAEGKRGPVGVYTAPPRCTGQKIIRADTDPHDVTRGHAGGHVTDTR
ncbi:uncharacterized protein K489DRAFT_219770 [Dissoconium aciculare CBS 342.82]|uniref:Uncharacterized protein n=1 Tax=Dissoconium aciculare CBS 342.82 TaxID=1314786 RepID=A0A6J3M4E7_9PEZI|nr:uncharacterized protein K489DRAFT_219770 [Dissoconium aciculare CBS 342.82]KAF1822900.1 hypothetical protein K489DRAFT_219770 [Dissoconium aciculare CBS 342.82]